MDKIVESQKEIPINIGGIAGFIKEMTPANFIEMQNFMLKKKAMAIDVVFANDRDVRIELKKELLNAKNEIGSKKKDNDDNDNNYDVESMYYLLYIRFSGRDKITFEQFFNDKEGVEEAAALAFPQEDGDKKNVKQGQRK